MSVAGEAVPIAACEPARTVAPIDAEALSALIRALGDRGEIARVRGAGTELPQANEGAQADVLLSTLSLSGIVELDAEEGVAYVAAGTPVATLRAAAARDGLDVPLAPPSVLSSVGGALAAAALGPRALGYGLPRDVVLGLDVVLGSGERTRCGGRVVKNVTGYDLAKLYVGSLGTLCVITHAWLRLRPLPERVQVLAAPLGAGEAAFSSALAAARLSGARAAALVDAELISEFADPLPGLPPGGRLLLVELAADVPVVAEGAAWLAGRHGAVSVGEAATEALGALEGPAGDPRFDHTLRVRVTARPSRLAAAHALLREAGALVVVHPGLSLLCARFALTTGDGAREAGARVRHVDAAIAATRAAARAGEGYAVLAAAPHGVRTGREVLDAPPAPALQRGLREQFDPKAVLDPARAAGSRA